MYYRKVNGEWHATLLFAAIAQLGERQTEDLKVPGSIPGGGTFLLKWSTHGLVGYDVCFTRSRSPVRSRVGVVAFSALVA